MMAIIHAFLFDPDFLNTTSVLDPVRKNGGLCVPSQQSLSYFVTPEELIDPRVLRASNLNTILTAKSRLIIDQVEHPQVLADIQSTWTVTERQHLFAIIDQLCFAYTPNATAAQVELALAALPQYLPASYVYSNTTSAATVYVNGGQSAIICPDYVTFTFVIANGTQYQLRVWLSNQKFYQLYPLSTIGAAIPPLPLSELYTLSISGSTASVFATALAASTASQQQLQGYIQSAQYSGYAAQGVTFVDGNGNATIVQFNLLYNGCAPGAIAIRTAIRTLLLNSGVGTAAGWQAIAPALFVTELFYLLPMWELTTTLVNVIIYPNVAPVQQVLSDATTALFDLPTGFVAANADLITVFYNGMTVIAVPDSENVGTRLSLSGEHPTYQDVATTSLAFDTMTALTRQFAALLGAAISAAAGNPISNSALAVYTPPNDTRTYITFTVADVAYYVMTRASYLALVTGA
jgi:hypothetical protein